MKCKANVVFLLLSGIFLLLVNNANSANAPGANGRYFSHRANAVKNVKYQFAGAEQPVTFTANEPSTNQSLGYEDIVSNSPGLILGTTTYDLQSNSRVNRQVDWRGTHDIHMTWMIASNSDLTDLDRGTSYSFWDADGGELLFSGGCDIHPRLGNPNNYSGYVGLDVDTEGKVVIGNHHIEGANFRTTVWYDFFAGSCFFSPYKRGIPDSIMQYGLPQNEIDIGDFSMSWPQIEYQVYNGDTVTHAVTNQWEINNPNIDASWSTYFRRVGSDTLGGWEYPPMIIDKIQTISQCVSASRNSGKVAIVWQAPPGAYPGDTESMDREDLDPGLGSSQRFNEIFYMISNDMGDNWGSTINITQHDSTVGGWLGHGDMSVLIDQSDNLHILTSMREILPYTASESGGYGEFAHFWGARLFHWDELNNEMRPVKDANWDLPDSGCTGGVWNEMSIVKPMLSQCGDNFYAFFIQFNDIYNGIDNDCHEGNYNGQYSFNTANGEIWMSVSEDGGYSWDIARNLTNTYTPHCWHDESMAPLPVCESDHYVSTSRFGMDISGGGNYSGIEIVDPTGTYSGTQYIDVSYLNDKFPGSVVQDDGIWTTNPYKWFRVPCIDAIPNPVLAYAPKKIGRPTWTKPGVQLDTTLLLENIGNTDLQISTIATITPTFSGWLGVGNTGPITLDIGSNSSLILDVYLNQGGIISSGPNVVDGYIEITSDAEGGSVDSIPVTLIVADTIQAPEYAEIRTDCKRMIYSNHGNIGKSGIGSYNLDFVGFDSTDCDTTDNTASATGDIADIYLYDASPFIMRNDGSDTLFNNSIYGAGWYDEESFVPFEGAITDSITYPDYQYGFSGRYLTSDSTITYESHYYAPTSPANCDFIIVKEVVYNNSEFNYSDVIFGDLLDWDIPADSGSRNQSGFDDSPNMQLMYTYGYDYGPTDDPNNDCVNDDARVGGVAFYGGYNLPFCPHFNSNDSLIAPKAQWTHLNSDWVYPTGSFPLSPLWDKAINTNGYETWEATADQTNSDSVAQDLHHVIVYGVFDLAMRDTLTFVKIMATEYNGGISGLTQTITDARTWIDAHPEIFSWPERYEEGCSCCILPGDANCDGRVNILDVTALVGWLYKYGIPPCCIDQADANGNNTVNILDVTYLIAYLYKGGPTPICGTTGQ